MKSFLPLVLVIFFTLLPGLALAVSPTVGTITPAFGTSNPNETVLFTTTYIDLDGWTNILGANLLINTSTNGANCFYGYYNQNTNRLYLRNDANNRWLGGYTPGSANIIENSYARLNCAATTVSGLGTTLTINWSITFKSPFTGTKGLFLYVMDDIKLNSGWVIKGKWTIRNQRPSVGTIIPSSGASAPLNPVSFTTTYTDPDGWLNIQYVYLLINTSTARANCFYGYYNQNTNKLYLRNDANTRWLGGYIPGSARVIENSYARLNCASTTVSGLDTTLTVNWDITFKPAFTGAKNTYLYVRDDANTYAGYTQAGTWTIDATPPAGSIIINDNAEYTNLSQINLTLSATDLETEVTQMQFSNDNISWSTPEPYNTMKEWELSLGDGEKTVYARFKNGADLWSDVASDSIILDTTSPQIRITIPVDNFNTAQDSVVVWGEIDDNEASVIVNGINATVGNDQFSVNEIPLENGLNLITATATDPAGNTSTNSINVNLSNLPPAEILIDDFSDVDTNRNILGFWTSDNQSCRESVDIAGQHKISWDNNSSYWYSDLWDTNTLPVGTNASYYERLTFKVRGDTGGENFSVELEDIPYGINFNKKVEISNYANITTDWQEVTIPLKDFTIQGVWETQTRSIVFHFDETSSGTIYIDDIKFRPCLIDNFADDNLGINSLGYQTEDDGTLVENIDVDGYHKLQWDSNNDHWWSSLWDGSDEFNASGFGYIYMRIKGEVGGENFSLELQDNAGESAVGVSNYINIDRTWRYVYIPLGDFSVDRTKLQRLILRFNRTPTGTIYIDKIGITSTNGSANVKPQSSGPVKVIGRQLLVNNSPFHVKGIVYQPTPIGTSPNMNNGLYQDENIYNRDIPLLRELGCNTIRLFKKLNSHNFLNACYNNGIYVIMGFPIDYIDLGNPGVRELLRQEFMEYVREYKDEPGVLMWALGNEINMTYEGNIQDWYSLANELAGIAYEVEGDRYHPVMIVNRDIEDIGGQESFSTDDQLNYIDLWGINAYRGYTYRGFFSDYFQTSAKPILVTEYGADSWHSGIMPSQGYPDPYTQAEYYLNNWNEIKNSVVCMGGVLMEYTDEWWKVVGGNYNVQDYGGFDNRYDQPDNFSNEEFWGLFRIQDNGDNPDILIPRKAYEVMKLGFDNLSYPEILLAWEFNTDSDPEGWTPINSLTDFVVEGGVLQTEVSGSNPLMDSPGDISINGLLYSGIEIRLRVGNGSTARLYWKKEGELDFSSENSRDFLLFRDGDFHIYYIYLGDHPNWNSRITQLRLNPTSATNGTIEIDYIRIVKGELPEDFISPENVSNLTANSGNERVFLNWTPSPNTNGDLVDQLLYINDDEPISLGPVATSYEVSGLTNGLTYTFKITCVDNMLNESSGVTVQAIPRDTTAPEDITNLTADAGDSRVTFNWVPSINTEGDLADQILYIDNGPGVRIGPLTNTYIVDRLNNDQLYSFRITCVDEVPNESPGVTVQAIPQSATAPVVEITSPVDRSITSATTITVSGTINNNSATVAVNGIPALVSSGIFTVDITLANEEANEILAIGEFDGQRGYDSITVYRDTTVPELEITTPRDGETVTGYE